MSGTKVLITGLSNSGKTSLVKNLKNTLVLARDGKPFPFPMAHRNLKDFETVSDLLDEMVDAIEKYQEKLKVLPETVVIDSVSRIFTEIETNCQKKFTGFEVWARINKEISALVDFVEEVREQGINVVLIAHAVWDETSGKYTEVAKGSFAKMGGFLSTVDYAIYIEHKGTKRIVHHRQKNLARTLAEAIPDNQSVEDFNLQNYIDTIKSMSVEITEKWSI